MDRHLRDYLQLVDIVDGVTAHEVDCEVCGGDAHEVLVREVEAGEGRFAVLPVVGCTRCGHVYQNPRFNKEFYDTYYDKYYRLMLFGNSEPDREFIVDQVRRGEALFKSLESRLPAKGRLLDVGCSAGGLMVAFAKRGWQVFGTDPDAAYAKVGRERLGLEVQTIPAEDMRLPAAHFDLTIITGSLEHVFDVNRVLGLCREACAPGGLMFIEGRALGYGVQKGYFSHNHRRYLSRDAIELLMRKHGWSPELSTDAPLCGPTRPGGVYVLGRAAEPVALPALHRQIEEGQRDPLSRVRAQCADLRGAA